VASDAKAGLLTMAELRDKLKQVHSNARYSEEPDIAAASEEMLRAATAGDDAALTTAVERFDQDCTAVGL
jgi:hypothetical protein